VLAGHAVASLIKSLIPIVLMSLTGLVVGWGIHSSLPHVIAGYALMIGFSFAVIWIGVFLGSILATPEGVQGIAFIAIFPLTFIASTFVPTSTLPGILRTIAEWNPVTSLANALRNLFENPGGIPPKTGAWPLQHPVLYTIIWIGIIVFVFAPLAVRAYQRSIRS
jgi:ABC-type polysaccharide/polyol phosphate export permease